MRAVAAPITARSTRCSASAPIEAPTSSTIDSPRKVGHSAAIAGRSIPGKRLEIEFRHRHQRAGIAGRHDHVGVALLDGVDGEPHRGFPAAVAQRLARLVLHPHRDVGVDEPRRGFQRRAARRAAARPARNCRRTGIRCRDGAPAPARRRRRPRRGRGLPPSHRAQCGPCLTLNDLAVLILGPRKMGMRHRRARIAVRAPGNNCVQWPSRPWPFVSPASAANGPSSGLAVRRRLENRARLAGIGIEPEDQELGGERAQIDHAVDQRLRIRSISSARSASRARRPCPSRASRGCGGTKTRSTVSSTSLASGSSVTTQFWPTVAETCPATCRPSIAAPRHVEIRFKPRQFAQSRRSWPRPRATSASAVRSKCWPVSANIFHRNGNSTAPAERDLGRRLVCLVLGFTLMHAQ